MKRSSGEKPPVAMISRSHMERSESNTEGSSDALASDSAAASSGMVRSTSLPPYGGMLFKAFCSALKNLRLLGSMDSWAGAIMPDNLRSPRCDGQAGEHRLRHLVKERQAVQQLSLAIPGQSDQAGEQHQGRPGPRSSVLRR